MGRNLLLTGKPRSTFYSRERVRVLCLRVRVLCLRVRLLCLRVRVLCLHVRVLCLPEEIKGFILNFVPLCEGRGRGPLERGWSIFRALQLRCSYHHFHRRRHYRHQHHYHRHQYHRFHHYHQSIRSICWG